MLLANLSWGGFGGAELETYSLGVSLSGGGGGGGGLGCLGFLTGAYGVAGE